MRERMTKAQTTRSRHVESDYAFHSYLAIDRIRTRQRNRIRTNGNIPPKLTFGQA